jgi:hypothetical protein
MICEIEKRKATPMKTSDHFTIIDTYDRLYWRYDSKYWLDLLFFNSEAHVALFYDGNHLCYIHGMTPKKIPVSFIESRYSFPYIKKLELEDIRKNGPNSYIKFKNGDIFYTVYLAEDESSPQLGEIHGPDQDGYAEILNAYLEGVPRKIIMLDRFPGT